MQNEQDKRLDTPSEANREKHINFLEAEERTGSNSDDDKRFGHTDEDQKRKEEWQRGLAEGEKARNENS
jgi:hypothetical protein